MRFVTTLLVLVLVIGCGGGGSSNRKQPIKPTNDPVKSNSQTVLAEGLTQHNYDLSEANRVGAIEIDIAAGDVSFFLDFGLANKGTTILVTELTAPSGSVIYRSDRSGNVTSEFTATPYGNNGDAGLMFPLTPQQTLEEGSYIIKIERENNARISTLRAIVKSVNEGEDVDMLSHTLDLNVFVTHSDTSRFGVMAVRELFDSRYRDVIDRIMLVHQIRLGTVTIVQANEAQRTAFSELNEEAEESDACNAALAGFNNDIALNLVFVNEIVSGDGGVAGFSSSPGSLNGDTAANRCFFVSQAAYDESTGLTQSQSDGMQAGNVLHEAGHFLGMPHTTEESGTQFDFYNDTAECDAATFDGMDNTMFNVLGVRDGSVSDHECGISGGAGNFLFYAGHQDFLPFEMSAEQAFLFRRHPLARPVR